ncbi:MAG TPA: hypothetical protein DEF79_11495 [Gammaproteobacteria bacterium]|nr:hypothetical protein [Gammaproteobacteria bacterium]|tara:strand:- start:300 stop:743 length:444 start_codon:yes stop_codon:yes gene_type:complete
MRKLITAVLIGLLASGCAEYLPISSGALEGRVLPLPPSLDRITQDKIIQLETSASDPYSVNLWVVEVVDYLHVFAGDNKATWVEHIEQNPNVRLRSGDEIFELEAVRVNDPEIFALFSEAWEAKYGNRPQNESVAQTYLYRLRPRSS